MRVLVVTNLVPDENAPQRGRWVRDQVAEVRARGVEVEEFGFPRGRSNYLPATRRLRALLRRERYDLVHAHYGLAGWVARAAGARPLIVTFHGTDVRHPVVGPLSRRLAWRADLVAGVSRALFEEENGRPGLPAVPGAVVLPTGPELGRFAPTPRAAARTGKHARVARVDAGVTPGRGQGEGHDDDVRRGKACLHGAARSVGAGTLAGLIWGAQSVVIHILSATPNASETIG